MNVIYDLQVAVPTSGFKLTNDLALYGTFKVDVALLESAGVRTPMLTTFKVYFYKIEPTTGTVITQIASVEARSTNARSSLWSFNNLTLPGSSLLMGFHAMQVEVVWESDLYVDGPGATVAVPKESLSNLTFDWYLNLLP